MSCDLDLSTGEVFQEQIDVDLSGRMDVTFMRHYSSTSSQTGPLGTGWTHSLVARLHLRADGLTLEQGQAEVEYPWAVFEEPDGPRIRRDQRAIRMYDPDGAEQHYAVLQPGASTYYLIRDQDRHGNAVRFVYEQGRLAMVITPEEKKLHFLYGHSGFLERLAVSHDGLQRTPLTLFRYQVDARGDLVAITDSRGFTEQYEYNDHLLVRHQNRTGGNTYYAYDSGRRCCRSWQDGARNVRMLDHDPVRMASLLTDSYGRRTVQRFNEAGLVVEQVDPLGHVAQVAYDENGNFIALVDELGMMGEATTYDPETRQLLQQEANGAELVTEFDEQNRVWRTGRAEDEMRTFIYDDRSNVVGIALGDGATWTIEHNARGEVVKGVDPQGYAVMSEGSPTGDRVRVRDQQGVLLDQQFDVLGNLVAYTDTSGQQTRLEYEGPDTLRSEVLADGRATRYTHDGEGRLVELVDPEGRVQRFIHDPFGLYVGEQDALGQTVQYAYDREENVNRITNKKGETFHLTYDALDREIVRRYFDGHVQTFTYDARGRRIRIEDENNRVTTLEYDDADRVVRQTLPDGTVQEFDWDEADRVTRISEERPSSEGASTRQLQLEYNHHDLVTREAHEDYWIERDYDAVGHVMEIRDSWGGETRYQRGPRYNLETLYEAGRAFSFEWDHRDYLQSIVYPNGMRHEFTIDAWGRTTACVLYGSDGTSKARRTFRYDRGDRLIQRTRNLDVHRYGYDPLGRLSQVANEAGQTVEHYSYDADDNLIASHRGRLEMATGDRVVRAGQWRFEYDRTGKRIGRSNGPSSWRFEYDGDDQLTEVFENGVTVARYGYDLLNRRMSKTTPTGTHRFLYDGFHALRAERQNETQIRYVYLPGLDIPLACIVGDTWYFYSVDQLGMPSEIWTEEGDLYATIEHETYGTQRRVVSASGVPVDVPFLFPGQYYDKETGLCYNTFRYYDPETASYITPDPLSILSEINHYIYPRNPLTWMDPDGLLSLVFECKKTPKCDWNQMACAKWIARQKVAAINRQLKKRQLKKCSHCKRSKQREYYNKTCGGKLNSSHQIDHLHELQAGGPDKCCANLVSIPSKINNCLGGSVRRMMKAVNKIIPKGTTIATKGCTGGKCTAAQKKKSYVRPPKRDCKNAAPVC